jgi:glutathione S-transferase
MTADRNITFFHSPQTRSSGALTLLEELGAPFELKILNMKAGEQRQPAFLAINPLGKVPTLLDGDALVTEQVAIFIHLADRFPEARLAPATDDPRRGPYLRWLVYYAACFEPAVLDKFQGLDPAPPTQAPYGDYESMLGVVEAQLAKAPYLLGDRMTAADVLWGTALNWVLMFGLVPKRPVFVDYAARMADRPAARRVTERDAALAAEHEAQAQETQRQMA